MLTKHAIHERANYNGWVKGLINKRSTRQDQPDHQSGHCLGISIIVKESIKLLLLLFLGLE